MKKNKYVFVEKDKLPRIKETLSIDELLNNSECNEDLNYMYKEDYAYIGIKNAPLVAEAKKHDTISPNRPLYSSKLGKQGIGGVIWNNAFVILKRDKNKQYVGLTDNECKYFMQLFDEKSIEYANSIHFQS